jgi:hypothetical protein
LANDAAVAQVSDAGLDANHATQGTSARQPTYKTAGLNGRPCINFAAASQQWLATPTIAYGSPTGLTVFVVLSGVAANSGIVLESSTNGTATDGGWQLYHNNTTNKLELGVKIASKSAVNHVPTTTTTTTPQIWRGRLDTARQNTFNPVLALNGRREKGTWAQQGLSLASGTLADFALQIGARANGTIPLDGKIGAILVYNRALSLRECRQIEQYLSRRWGIGLAALDASIVWHGDSDFVGITGNNTNPAGPPTQTMGLLSGSYDWVEVSTNGKQIGSASVAGMYQDFAGAVAPHAGARGSKTVLCFNGGINDIQPDTGDVTGEIAFARWQAYITQARTAGYRYIVARTLQAISDSAAGGTAGVCEARRLVFNNLVRTTGLAPGVWADAVADVGADSHFDSQSDCADGAIYAADGGHRVNAGYAIEAGIWQTALGTLGLT